MAMAGLMAPLLCGGALAAAGAARGCPTPPVNVTEWMRRAPRPAADTINGVAYFDYQRVVENASHAEGPLDAQMRVIGANTSAGWVSLSPVVVVNDIADPGVRRDAVWTMADSTLAAAVQEAHRVGMKVLLKPHLQLDCAWDKPDGTKATCAGNSCNLWWSDSGTPCYRDYVGCNQAGQRAGGPHGPGGEAFGSSEWDRFMAAWGGILLDYARTVAEPYEVEALSVATELSCPTTTASNEGRWRALLRDLKAAAPNTKLIIAMHDKDMMSGGITTGPVPFLDAPELDILGFDAYHAFTNLQGVDVPSLPQWEGAWALRGQEIDPSNQPLSCTSPLEWYQGISNTYNKDIAFTEFGFYSVPQCAATPVGTGFGPSAQGDERCMVNSIEGTWAVFSRADWWAGGFWWDWNGRGYSKTDLSVDGKLLMQASMRALWGSK